MKNCDKISSGGLLGLIFWLWLQLAYPLLVCFDILWCHDPYTPETYETLTSYSHPLLSGIRSNLANSDTPEDAPTKKTSKVTYQSWYSLNNFIKEEPSTLSLRMDAYKIPGLFYRSGMVQSWNRMRFTQAFLEFSAWLSG